jgi:D-alanyl-D-alanine carboxypeptidase/D-alanyl-D-alanine-endopeptidase (penicillin-binding protein 4)
VNVRRVTCGRLTALAVLALALAVAPAASPANVPLPTRLTQALAVPNVSARAEGVMVVDLDSGKTAFARNPDLPLAPASNEKLALTYAALKELGPEYEFRTELLGVGWQDGAVWHGSLVLKGFGDPTLSSLGLKRLANQLAKTGIRRITGRLLADESWFDTVRTAPGWKSSFFLEECPPLSALVVDGDLVDNRYALSPAISAAAKLRRALRARGITTGPIAAGTAASGAYPLAQVNSKPLSDIVVEMDHNSDNYVAEVLLKALGAEVGGAGTTVAGDAVVIRSLAAAGIPLTGVQIVDGSGLSLDDRLTARAVASLLLLSWRDPDLRSVLWSALPVAGESGTLQHRLLDGPAHGAVRAKTGSTDLASALSGYASDRFAFSILQNGEPISSYYARLAQDRVAQALARVAAAVSR